MQKDFDKWNELKKQIDAKDEDQRLFFRDAEVWWFHLGLNIGFEMNGKDDEFMRPVIIIKKYNQYSFLALPLTTAKKKNQYNMFVGNIDGKDAYTNFSQLRNIDSKRLINKVGYIEEDLFKKIREKASQINLS